MSSDSDSWSEIQSERIKARKRAQEQKRASRAEENPAAFAWEKTDAGTYRCLVCDEPHEYQRLPQCLRHVKGFRSDGQTGLDEWS